MRKGGRLLYCPILFSNSGHVSGVSGIRPSYRMKRPLKILSEIVGAGKFNRPRWPSGLCGRTQAGVAPVRCRVRGFLSQPFCVRLRSPFITHRLFILRGGLRPGGLVRENSRPKLDDRKLETRYARISKEKILPYRRFAKNLSA